MPTPLPYTTYSEYLANLFPGEKIQKISLNAGFSCPNRDGSIGVGGCIYCDNSSFTPSYCMNISDPVRQLQEGKKFFGKKYPKMRFLAYFQSFTNTFCRTEQELETLYINIASQDDVAGLIIGTRPDCIPDNIIRMLSRISDQIPIIVEIGAETSFDNTLQLVNRHHTWADVTNAVNRLADAGLHPGLHLIAGLPGETPEMILETTSKATQLPIQTVKFHHLQVIRGTELERLFLANECNLYDFTLDSYIDLCVEIINIIPRRIAIERFLASSPPDKVVYPSWGIKNYQFVNLLHNRLRENNS